jgi:hypothetical protein
MNSFWLIYKKMAGGHFFKFPKNRFFQFWSYVAISSFIVWWFEAGNSSNDRECFSLQNGLLLIIFEGHLLWGKNQIWKNEDAVLVIKSWCDPRMYYQSTRSQPEFYICCSPAHDASFGILAIKKFHQEAIKFSFTQSMIWYKICHFQ